MKFDYIFGNPPFQDSKNRKKTQHKLWIDFTLKYFNEHLKDDGDMVWITPSSWGSPSNKIFKLFKDNDVDVLNLNIEHHFPNIGSTFSYYKVNKNKDKATSLVTMPNNTFSIKIDDNIKYFPVDFCNESVSIHKKVMFDTGDKFVLNYDYVTCHNVIRHTKELLQKKVEKWEEQVLVLTDERKKKEKIQKIKETKEKISNCFITVSEERTPKHVYPILHTNKKTWFSSIKQDFADSKKVMWSRSGYTKPFFDDGKLGCTDMGYYILVNSPEEGKRLEKFLNSKLMQYIFSTAKWSGFGNEIVFSSIPKINLSVDLNELDYYKIFNISEEEVKYLSSFGNKKNVKGAKKNKGKSETKSESRIKELGEVFTPKELVLEMLDLIPEKNWQDSEKTFLDPACGNGNFLIEIINKKMSHGLSPEDALKTTFGIDIMPDNVKECKQRIIDMLQQLNVNITNKITDVLDANIICRDGMTFLTFDSNYGKV